MIGHIYTLLLRPAAAPPPASSNGPSGGLTWLQGYTPKFDYRQPVKRRRRGKRDEILFLT